MPAADATTETESERGVELAAAALALAQRMSTGATMWCLAPSAPEHGRHIAVEFVHPVIVGKRALPAVAIAGPDPVRTLRAIATRGDVLVAVAHDDDPVVRDALRRAAAWGLTTIVLAVGPHARGWPADHVVAIADPTGTAVHDGGLVLRYHVLWELTHVCFEHPGLMRVDACANDEGGFCITCADEGRVAEVEELDGAGGARVRTAEGTETIDVTLVEPVRLHDLVLVHAGTAIARLDEPAIDE